jgi:hypothetical protein
MRSETASKWLLVGSVVMLCDSILCSILAEAVHRHVQYRDEWTQRTAMATRCTFHFALFTSIVGIVAAFRKKRCLLYIFMFLNFMAFLSASWMTRKWAEVNNLHCHEDFGPREVPVTIVTEESLSPYFTAIVLTRGTAMNEGDTHEEMRCMRIQLDRLRTIVLSLFAFFALITLCTFATVHAVEQEAAEPSEVVVAIPAICVADPSEDVLMQKQCSLDAASNSDSDNSLLITK